MKPALLDYDIYPKVFLINRPTEITIKPLGAHVAFSGSYTVAVMCMAHGHYQVYPERNNICTYDLSVDSDGCIRVQRLANEDGYNHEWIWNNLRNKKNIKIIVWDDDGRKLTETASDTPMYYNPNGGTKYHTDARCSSVRSAYLPLTGITYGDLAKYPYTSLTPCGTCAAPERPETVEAWNAAIDQAYEELGIEP